MDQMAITEVSKGQVEYAATATPTITLPATAILADDIIFVFIGHGNDENISVSTSSYAEVCDDLQTLQNEDLTTLGVWKRAVGGEESTDVVFSAVSARKGTIGCIVLRGVDTTPAIDTTVVHATHNIDSEPSNDDFILPAFTTTTNDAMLIAITACREDGNVTDISSDSGDAEWAKNVPDAADDVGMLGTREIIATAGAVGGDVHTWTDIQDTKEQIHGLIFAFRPAVGVTGIQVLRRRREEA